ncbi:MAG: bifunctional UDP-3-O-[3-hydroxymyristoyl] N-acetylglucosamine deacetylase/3-hydroxyacyl-ACP dehydratase [Verrucomicrobiota bacterium]|nr:bifunctional UDP-3-O-[3-hydroxymyristoyl] N-acetylglucosamine deacetylase/3-hydroxyacyl-ACP dehydratase [Verrucomicrobiota bacterium]
MHQQQTLSESVEFSGTGLHSGHKVTVKILPAPVNTGIVFRRVDLEGSPEIAARIENVSDTTRSTTLSKGNIKLHTIEHMLSTFSGMGIDNAIVELDANESPIGDGSARECCEMVRKAGVSLQAENREPLKILEPMGVQVGDSILSVFPYDGFKISCTSSDAKGEFTQYYSTIIDPETWETEISKARTFCFYEEIEFLIKNGLIKGGSLENAVIIRDDVVLTNEPLRYADEFVRHKILDLIGDLYLIGRPIQAHIIAIRPSHKVNCELARQLALIGGKPKVATQTFSPPKPESKAMLEPGKELPAPIPQDATSLNVKDIMKILPHRYPFLMIDRVAKMGGNKIQAVKCVSINEPFFEGHFPGHPIMPGVLQLEAIAQAAGILTLNKPENWGKIAYFMAADSVKWRKPVLPGDTLVIDVEVIKTRGKIGKAKGVCSVDGDVVSEGVVTFMMAKA